MTSSPAGRWTRSQRRILDFIACFNRPRQSRWRGVAVLHGLVVDWPISVRTPEGSEPATFHAGDRNSGQKNEYPDRFALESSRD
jgi:hypothetical protein